MAVNAIEKGISYLLWKAPKGKINPKSLGWVCPDKTINFATAEAANTYAKNTVIKALNCPNPYEKSVVVNGRQILYEQNGTSGRCLVPIDIEGTWVHGHPDFWGKGKTTPFSATDYEALMSVRKLDKAVIYNSVGEEAQLIKKSKLSFWDRILLKFISKDRYDMIKSQARIGGCSAGYNTALLKNCDADTTLKLNKLAMKRFIAMVKKDATNFEKYNQEYIKLYNQELEKALKDEKVASRLHQFWTKNADKYGVEYSSNFNNLV